MILMPVAHGPDFMAAVRISGFYLDIAPQPIQGRACGLYPALLSRILRIRSRPRFIPYCPRDRVLGTCWTHVWSSCSQKSSAFKLMVIMAAHFFPAGPFWSFHSHLSHLLSLTATRAGMLPVPVRYCDPVAIHTSFWTLCAVTDGPGSVSFPCEPITWDGS